jgi:uncharacterized protein (DUF2384 family)
MTIALNESKPWLRSRPDVGTTCETCYVDVRMKAQRRTARLVAHLDPRLHAASGHLNAKAIARRLGVSLERLAPALGYTPQGLSRNPTAERLQPRLAEFAHVLDRLRALLGDERSVAIWLRAPHPDLGGRTPLSLLLAGRADVVTTLLHLAESGQPA